MRILVESHYIYRTGWIDLTPLCYDNITNMISPPLICVLSKTSQ